MFIFPILKCRISHQFILEITNFPVGPSPFFRDPSTSIKKLLKEITEIDNATNKSDIKEKNKLLLILLSE